MSSGPGGKSGGGSFPPVGLMGFKYPHTGCFLVKKQMLYCKINA